MKICKIKGCNNKQKANGLCSKHYTQLQRYGKILKRTRFDKNEIIDCGDYCEICIYNIKCEEVARAKIDKEDLEKVKRFKWSLKEFDYVTTKINKKTVKLHQLILGKKDGFEIDHRDTNPLDNRKQNLRHCTHQQNCMNTKAKGYSWIKNRKKWYASICINYKQIYLGLFEKEQDAINARKIAKIKYFKEFTCKNI